MEKLVLRFYYLFIFFLSKTFCTKPENNGPGSTLFRRVSFIGRVLFFLCSSSSSCVISLSCRPLQDRCLLREFTGGICFCFSQREINGRVSWLQRRFFTMRHAGLVGLRMSRYVTPFFSGLYPAGLDSTRKGKRIRDIVPDFYRDRLRIPANSR